MGQLNDFLFEVRTMKMGPKAILYGVEHGNTQQAEEVVKHAASQFSPEEKTVFVGEGGDANSKYPEGSEQEYIYNKLKEYFTDLDNDSWDGKDFDVTDPNSYVFSEIKQKTGLDAKIVNAGVYAAMVGQGQDPTEVMKLMSPEGKRFLMDFGVQDPTVPSDEDIQLMYDLSFPQDTGGKPQEVSKITDAYNEVRDKNLIRKVKQYASKGYQVIACAGDSHLDLIKQ